MNGQRQCNAGDIAVLNFRNNLLRSTWLVFISFSLLFRERDNTQFILYKVASRKRLIQQAYRRLIIER